MYFESRAEAGVMLASKLAAYRYENTVVVALTDGAVQVGAQIAAELHSTLTLMLSEQIDVPGEGEIFGAVNQAGKFVYNGKFSTGEIDDYYSEFHGYLEDQKREKMSHINHLLGSGGIVEASMLYDHCVILLSDGLSGGYGLDVAMEFLKPLSIRRLIIAAPIASVQAVDRAHLLGDELCILGVTSNYIETNHYYEVNFVPDHDETINILNNFVLAWR